MAHYLLGSANVLRLVLSEAAQYLALVALKGTGTLKCVA
jgi:hypothetical protein